MAPFPETDNAPKAPDKEDKSRGEKGHTNELNKDKNKDAKLSNLNDGELKALLDEAITYKNPKDREGKSELFQDLLTEAEEDERNARAASAGGSQLVRHCNTAAKRSKHRRKQSSISENMMHGGSLDNLAKEELFEVTNHYRPRKTVSARQREGGSLPSNVNTGIFAPCDLFLEDVRRKDKLRQKDYIAIDMEHESLLKHDSLDQNYRDAPLIELSEGHMPAIPPKYTSKATLQVTDVDDGIHLQELEQSSERKTFDLESISAKVIPSRYNVQLPGGITTSLDYTKKVDENGNAVHQNATTGKTKKKKIQTDKNVVVLSAEKVEGHRSDIIHDMDKILEFLGEQQPGKNNNRSSLHHKSKQLNKHTSEDGGKSGKKQRAHSSKGKESRNELKKSNSLNEISSSKLDDFSFEPPKAGGAAAEEKVVLRARKNSNGAAEKPRERRSWGNVEPPPIQNLYSNPSLENIESADFRVVTKKKKTKKRRSSISSSGRRQTADGHPKHAPNRAPSPDLRRKSACSVPHSEKSNDSSDVDSVHSLPIDTKHLNSSLNEDAPISYADIARENRPKEKKTTPDKVPNYKAADGGEALVVLPQAVAVASAAVASNQPPDVHNIKSFPAISNAKVHQYYQQNSVQNYYSERSNVKKFDNRGKNNFVVANNNRNVRNNAQQKFNHMVNNNTIKNSIQTDLSIIQANEMETIQFNSQVMPLNIPDVQTIEKMHFMNHHNQKQPHQNPAKVATTETNNQPPAPPVSRQDSIPSAGADTSASSNASVTSSAASDCDRNSERTNRSADAEERPPVVILSGAGNREVSDLVFGFDLNEQLLNEDICENFIARYIAPSVYNEQSHNHDKIVNFIGLAWEDIIMSKEQVQYYSENL